MELSNQYRYEKLLKYMENNPQLQNGTVAYVQNEDKVGKYFENTTFFLSENNKNSDIYFKTVNGIKCIYKLLPLQNNEVFKIDQKVSTWKEFLISHNLSLSTMYNECVFFPILYEKVIVNPYNFRNKDINTRAKNALILSFELLDYSFGDFILEHDLSIDIIDTCLMQILCGLDRLYTVCNVNMHNDLHLNNVMVKKSSDKFIYFINNVPYLLTHIPYTFMLIDYGKCTFNDSLLDERRDNYIADLVHFIKSVYEKSDRVKRDLLDNILKKIPEKMYRQQNIFEILFAEYIDFPDDPTPQSLIDDNGGIITGDFVLFDNDVYCVTKQLLLNVRVYSKKNGLTLMQYDTLLKKGKKIKKKDYSQYNLQVRVNI